MDKLKKTYHIVTDSKNIMLMLFTIFVLFISWKTINQIEFNYNLEQQSRQKQEEVELLSLKSRNQTLKNEYYKTEYYQDLSARKQLGLVTEGERVLVLESSALANKEELIKKLTEGSGEPVASNSIKSSPLEQWLQFFKGDSPR